MQFVNLQIQIDRIAGCDLAAASHLSRSGATGPRAAAQSLRPRRHTAHGRARSHWADPRGNSWNAAAQRPAQSAAALHRLVEGNSSWNIEWRDLSSHEGNLKNMTRWHYSG